MANFSTIRAKIKANLDTIAELGFVADFHDANLTDFPAATFDLSLADSEFITNKENLRTMTYEIVLYQEVEVLGLAEAKDLLDALAIKVIDLFETDFNLGGEVDWCQPLVGPRGQFKSPIGQVFFQTLTLECKFSKLVIT
ncbi:hypothetical protein LCGC14_1220830 [marine sediment metagenome]|uniref:Uncharacterized protein n=1 Tax=marine sediment metagenome TaxID=412755 RepID=A0A0F9NTK7_9ZZZZ